MLSPLRKAVNFARFSREKVGLRPLVWGALLTGLALVLAFVPLYNLLGYDFAFALGLGAALAGVDIGHGQAAGARAALGRAPAGGELARVFGRAAALAAATLILPLVLGLANAARVRNCSLPAGLGFFALLPLPSALFAATAGVLAGLVTPSRRRGRLLAFALPAASILWTLLRLYRDPPVFAFDPFGGYFPGPIYDEALRPPLTLLLFRVANVVWAATAIVLALGFTANGRDPRRWRPAVLAAALTLIAASVVLYATGGRLGFHIARADLARVLAGSEATEHFVIHFVPGSKSRTDVALEAEDLEFRYQQLRQTFGVEPKLPITVWDFPDGGVKKALVGAGDTLYAKPWTREMFVQEHFPSKRLRHEMAHVFAGAFGDPFFGVALSWRWTPLPHPALAMGLVEGIAEAADADDPWGDATIHQEAAAMIAAGLAPPLADVVGAGFSTLAGARAYTLAGSFSAFLLTTRGADKLRALYRSAGNFSDVYRVPLGDLERDWRHFLAGQPLTRQERAHATEEFRRGAIFGRVCARELGARVAEARGLVGSDPARAVELLRSTCHDDPNEPLFRLALARAEVAAGAASAARTELAHLALDGTLTVPLRAEAESLAAAIDFAARDYANAETHQRRALDLAATDADRRQALAKLEGLSSPAARATLGRALYADTVEPDVDQVLIFFLFGEYARLHAANRLGPYLLGRQLIGRDAARALPLLSRACGDEQLADATGRPTLATLAPEFERECRRMIADAAYRIGDFVRARAALARLATDATEADRLRALDMRARVDWAAALRDGAVGQPAAGGTR
jgi:hypothetical protein